MADALKAAGVSEVLVVRGDPPHDLSHRTWPNTSEDIIRRFKRHHPELRVYAAFDPYRLGLRDELTGVMRKLDAGADGFFTQPLFDLRLLEICMEMLPGQTVYWGVAPVLGARAKAYWETTNRVVFPAGFRAGDGVEQEFRPRRAQADPRPRRQCVSDADPRRSRQLFGGAAGGLKEKKAAAF